MEAWERNSTWEIVDKLRNKKEIYFRWIFIVKHKTYGSLDMYKTKLVENEYAQTYEIDYEDTFFLLQIWVQFELFSYDNSFWIAITLVECERCHFL